MLILNPWCYQITRLLCSSDSTEGINLIPHFCSVERITRLILSCKIFPISNTASVRLVDGPNPWSGRVEIFHDDTWGTICDYEWDIDDVQVVCWQLGFSGAKEATLDGYFGEGAGPIHMIGAACTGSENRLSACPSLCLRKPVCTHEQDAGAICRNGSDSD